MKKQFLLIILFLLPGCIVQKVDDGSGSVESEVAVEAETAVKVYAKLLSEGVDKIDWSTEESAGQSIQAIREAARKAAFKPLNERMNSIDPWDPEKAERIGKEIQRGYSCASAN